MKTSVIKPLKIFVCPAFGLTADILYLGCSKGLAFVKKCQMGDEF